MCGSLVCQGHTWNGLKVRDHALRLKAKRAVEDGLAAALQQQHCVKSLQTLIISQAQVSSSS